MTHLFLVAIFMLRGESGAPGVTGPRGADGANGLNGSPVSVSCVAPEFLQTISASGVPTCVRPSGAVAATTRTLILRPFDFEAYDTVSTSGAARVAWSRDGARLRRTVVGQASRMEAALHLPDGARVTFVACAARSNVTQDLTVRLWSKTGAGSVECSSATKTGAALSVMTLPSTCPEVVNNSVVTPAFNQLSLTVGATADNVTAGWGLYVCEVSFLVTTLLP